MWHWWDCIIPEKCSYVVTSDLRGSQYLVRPCALSVTPLPVTIISDLPPTPYRLILFLKLRCDLPPKRSVLLLNM